MNKTLQRHLDAILSGEVTKGNVIGLRKAINHAERLRNRHEMALREGLRHAK